MQKCIVLVFLFTISIFAESVDEQCDFSDTVDLSNATKVNENEINFKGYNYPINQFKYYDYVINGGIKENVARHLRACICELKSEKPCVTVCCLDGQAKKTHSDSCYGNDAHDIIVNMTLNGSNFETINLKSQTRFHLIRKKPCQAMTEVDEEFNEFWYLNKVRNKNHLKFFKTVLTTSQST